MDDSRPRSSDYPLLILANVIWGSTDTAAKFAVADLGPIGLAWTRFTVAVLFFLPALWMRRREIPRTLSGLLPFVALGSCGYFLNFILCYHGLELAPASHATALRVSESLAILALSGLLLRERIGRRAIFGVAVGGLGVLVVLDVDFSNLGMFASGYRLGDLLILSGIVVEGLYTVLGKRVLVSIRPLTATALACFFGWMLLTISYFPELPGLVARPPGAGSLLAGLYLGLLATGFGYVLWYRVLRRRQSHLVGLTIMAQPVVGLPLAALFWGDELSPGFLLGAGLIAGGVYLALAGSDSPPTEGPTAME